MTKLQELIYDLIFSDNLDYRIDLSEYLDDIYKHDSFITEMKKILKKAKVSVLSSKAKLDGVTVIWILKVRR